MLRLPVAVPFSCLVWLVVGCPDRRPPTPDPDAGTLEFVGRACNVDAECGSLRCDKVRRQCICLSDDSCRGGKPDDPVRYCNNYTGLCVTEISGCTKDADCKDPATGQVDGTLYCDSSIRSCRPKKSFCEPCASDNECGGLEDNCVADATLGERFCGRACDENADCPRGATCQTLNDKKQCWPAANPLQPTEKVTCKNFKGCTPDSLKTCNVTGDCGDESQRCDPARGKCVAVAQVCAFGTVCDPRNKICVAECTADPDCGDPKLRCTNRICEPVGECTKDEECPPNKVCSLPAGQATGQCVSFCQADPDCALGTVCSRGTDGRYRCAPGCANNVGCAVDQRCNALTKTCEGPVVGNVRICQSASACASCELCNLARSECFSAKGTFPYCTPCTSPTECAGGTCVQMDDGKSYCAKYCQPGQECPQGFTCLPISGGQSACVPSNRQCTGKCP